MGSAPNDPVKPVAENEEDGFVESELLVEDISIDGMCGVY